MLWLVFSYYLYTLCEHPKSHPMKILFTLALLFATFTVSAQDAMYAESWESTAKNTAPTATPAKRNNTIILETPDDYATALRKMVNILSDEGYGLQTVDKDLGILTTTAKGYKGGTMLLNIQVREGDSTQVIIRGMWDGLNLEMWGVSTDSKYNIEYKGMKGGPKMIAWDEMNKVASSYKGATISYATK